MADEKKVALNAYSILRLCHCCGFLNESPQEVLKCIHCSKSFLPIQYFEKIKSKATQNQSVFESPIKQQNSGFNELNPIYGLIVFW